MSGGRRWVAPAVSLLTTLLVLGPLIGPGVTLRYDMAWAPLPTWTPWVLGVGVPAPRAVPSDAAAVLVGQLVGADLAQSLVLGAVLVTLGLGTASLLGELRPGAGAAARSVAVVLVTWSLFVAERLSLGQWTVLLGAAVLPLGLLAVVRLRRGSPGTVLLVSSVLLAGLGGANSMVVLLAPLLVACLWPRPRWRVAGGVVVLAAGVSAVWAVPALVSRPDASGASVAAFAPRADGAVGVVGALLSGGGVWNPVTHPPELGSAVVSVAMLVLVSGGVVAAALCCRDAGGPVVVGAAAVTLLVAVLAAVPDLSGAWTALVTGLPGGGLLRDPQKLAAAWVVVAAVGAGAAVDVLARRAGSTVGGIVAVFGMLLPVALLPGLAWGLGGALAGARLPAEYAEAVAAAEGGPSGTVAVLPWQQYRRYPWNERRVSLTVAPRVVDRPVLLDDALPVQEGLVEGEDPRAARVRAALAAGTPPGPALRAEGARLVFVEKGSTPTPDPGDLGRVLYDSAAAAVVDLGPGPPPEPVDTGPVLSGWAVTLATYLGLLGWWLVRATRSGRSLLSFRP